MAKKFAGLLSGQEILLSYYGGNRVGCGFEVHHDHWRVAIEGFAVGLDLVNWFCPARLYRVWGEGGAAGQGQQQE
jgi:hypothetical protein